jgi:hypothetical protein
LCGKRVQSDFEASASGGIGATNFDTNAIADLKFFAAAAEVRLLSGARGRFSVTRGRFVRRGRRRCGNDMLAGVPGRRLLNGDQSAIESRAATRSHMLGKGKALRRQLCLGRTMRSSQLD